MEAMEIYTENRPRPRLQEFRFLREIISTAAFIVAAFTFLRLAIPGSVVQGRSMQPSFEDGQRILISRVGYMFGDPDRSDIIIFNSPSPLESNEPPLIKRVIGIPGDTVEIINTQVYVNGELLNEPYVNEPCRPSRCNDAIWELGPNGYFVMGDNRNNSRDSRVFGPIQRDHIIGEALFRFWPPENIGIIRH
jgi:signal peptidase I